MEMRGLVTVEISPVERTGGEGVQHGELRDGLTIVKAVANRRRQNEGVAVLRQKTTRERLVSNLATFSWRRLRARGRRGTAAAPPLPR
jgi:hypothetical protein